MDTKDNTATAAGGARISLNLIDAIDLLREARDINEAAFMACNNIANRRHQAALQRIIGMSGDIMRHVSENLEVIRADAREGGAA